MLSAGLGDVVDKEEERLVAWKSIIEKLNWKSTNANLLKWNGRKSLG